MFGRKSKPCKVYEYGCLQPTKGEEVMIEEIRRRNNLWNKLVEIEREHRAKARELLEVPDDPVYPLIKELEKVREEIKKKRKKERSGKVDVKDLQGKAKKLREEIKNAQKELKKRKKEVKEINREKLNMLEKERREKVKEIKSTFGLYWGNYDEVLRNYEQARSKAMKEGAELKFHKFDGTGKVTIRFQKGLPVTGVFGNDTRLQIDEVPLEAWEHPIRAVRRKKARTKIRLRVTSDESKKPVWVELPMVMHRPIPEDSEIRAASVVREKVGRQYRYKVVITATCEDAQIPQGRGTIGIDLGWRMVNEGLRVAYWADDQGQHGQLLLTHDVLYEFQKCNELRSVRDIHFNEIKEELIEWKKNNKVPEWLEKELKNLHAWRSQGRLVLLIAKWEENRFTGDEEIFTKLNYWRDRENHLYDWEANLRDQVHRRRREIYRVFAAGISRNYDTVAIEDFDLRKVAKKADAEEKSAGSLPADKQRFIASVSELRLALINACQKRGVKVERIDSRYTTIECHSCGYREKFETDKQIYWTCPKCSTQWDQDYNAAVNLVHKALLQKSGAV